MRFINCLLSATFFYFYLTESSPWLAAFSIFHALLLISAPATAIVHIYENKDIP